MPNSCHRAINAKNMMNRCNRNVLPTEKSLVVSFWTFLKFLRNQSEIERTETTKNFCWCRGIFL